jgi:hypothetical protein
MQLVRSRDQAPVVDIDRRISIGEHMFGVEGSCSDEEAHGDEPHGPQGDCNHEQQRRDHSAGHKQRDRPEAVMRSR